MEAYSIAMRNAKPGPVISTSSPLTAAGAIEETLVDKAITFMVQSITTSAAAFDRVWDDGIADWLASGAQAVIDERAEKYVAP
jgi:putative aldouronate transport system substrate-binding protein